jgi:hypothetical protein
MEKICLNCGKSCDRLRKTFCDNCYTKYRVFGNPNYSRAAFPKSLTDQQHSLIIGSMLGDGHLRKEENNHNAALNIERSQKDYQYLEWEANIINNMLTKAGVTKRDRYDERTNKIYHSCSFITRSLIVLNSFHNEWYINKIKVVPNNLRLNSEIIAIWFCDDGWIDTSSSINRFEIGLATNSFSKDEVYFLQSLLNDRYNEYFTVSCRTDTEKNQYVIHGSDSASRALISDIDSVFPEGMQRKRLWDNPDTCFYHNAPIKRKSHYISSNERKSKVDSFINSHSEFYLTELAEYLEWSFTRKNGKTEWDTQNVKRYLKYYINNNILIEDPYKNNYKKGIKYRKI